MKINSRAAGPIWAVMIYEFFGTALIVYSFNLTDSPNAMVRGFAYFVGVIIAYQISGACFNPAITLGMALAERNAKKIVLYLI